MRYRFGEYVLDTQRHELHHAGEPIKLRRKVFQVFVYLLAHRDRVVPKQELLVQLWPDQFVGEEALTSCIKELRRTLGDTGRTPRFLRTLHRQGYRFVAEAEVREHFPADDAPHALHEGEGATRAAEVPSSTLVPPLADTGNTTVEALDGEHKQVTVLCGALAAARTLAADLGPEAMYHLMHDVLALAQDTVQRYEGTLTQVTGEGFLALFGAPVAQEDHARRAVLAAFELRQRLRVPNTIRGQPHGVAVRLGLHTGPAVVGPLAYGSHGPYIAAGDTLHVATRLQQQAAPDTVLVSAATYALVQDEVQGEACETSSLDGLSPPGPVYAIRGFLRRRAGVPRRGARPLSRFMGRSQELALLQERLAQAVNGQGQVIGIAGEPGMGKSRLLAEFVHRLRGRPVSCCEGDCLPYGNATPYLPVRDLLWQLWNLPDAASATALTATVQQRLREAGVTSEAEALVLLQLLDVPVDLGSVAPLDPAIRRKRTFALLWHVIRQASRRQPLILAVENLHWIDPTSEAWLASVVEHLGDVPVLLLVTYRSGYQPPWLRHSAATQMALPRLSTRDSLVMLQSVPRAAQLPVPVQEAIVAKAAGNPFFVEELSWGAVEHGDYAGPLPLPDTIEAVLAARIDRLSPVEKRLLQTAAVIGTEIPFPLLQAVADGPEEGLQSSLAYLQGAEFQYERSLYPELAYAFKHALTQEVAYGGLLPDRRHALHARIVEALEALAPERAVEQVERLAHHALRGEVWDKAVVYYRQAGEKAEDRAAPQEAVAYFEQALQALACLPEHGDTRVLALELRLALDTPLNNLGEYGRRLTLLREAEALARALNDRVRLARVLAGVAQLLRIMGAVDGAIAVGQQALELAVELRESALQAEAATHLGEAYAAKGDFGRAAELLRQSVETADRESGRFGMILRIRSRAWLAQALGELGAFVEGRRHGEEALRLATMGAQGSLPILALRRLGQLYLVQGELAQAIRVSEQGLSLCRASGEQDLLRGIMANLGYAYALEGRLAEGRVLLEEAIGKSLRTGGGATHAYHWLSEVCRLAGYDDEARQHARQALKRARQQKERGKEALALFQLEAVHAQDSPPDVQQAEACYQEALLLAEELAMRPLQAHCHRGLGTLYAKAGQHDQARAALSTAIELYRGMAMTFWLPQTEAALAEVEGIVSPSLPARVE